MARILLLPTAGLRPLYGESQESKVAQPTVQGLMRLNATVTEIEKGDVAFVLIVGGNRSEEKSEAEVYRSYLRHFIMTRIRNDLASAQINPNIVIDAQARLINRDLWKFVRSGRMDAVLGINSPSQRKEARVEVVAYDIFYERIRIILHRLGYSNTCKIDTREKGHYVSLQEKLLLWTTKIDPFFLWSPIGLLAVLMAEVTRQDF